MSAQRTLINCGKSEELPLRPEDLGDGCIEKRIRTRVRRIENSNILQSELNNEHFRFMRQRRKWTHLQQKAVLATFCTLAGSNLNSKAGRSCSYTEQSDHFTSD